MVVWLPPKNVSLTCEWKHRCSEVNRDLRFNSVVQPGVCNVMPVKKARRDGWCGFPRRTYPSHVSGNPVAIKLTDLQYVLTVLCMYGHTYSKSMDQPDKVANPARDQVNRENSYFPVRVRAGEFGLARRVRQASPVPRQSAHLHTQAESGAYLRDSSRFPRRRPFIYLKSPYAIGSVPSFSDHATAYRWRSLPRVRRHRASKPQVSSERVLPWRVTMDPIIYASLSHTHHWYEVGVLKVPAVLCNTKDLGIYLNFLFALRYKVCR